MAATDFGALSDAVKKVWATETWQEGRDQSFWFANQFMGRSDTDMNRPIQRVTKLTETERGLECVMQLVADLIGDGVVGDNELEGNEEALFNDAQTIRIDQLRNGTRSKGSMAEQATVIRFRATSREKLSFWMSDKVDEMMFLTGSGRAFTLNTDGSTRSGSQLNQLTFAADVSAATTNRIRFAGSATSEATVTTSDTITWNEIVSLRTFMERQKIRPIRDRGKNYYAIVMSTEQARDLMLDSTYQTIVSRAGERGSTNVLFNNAMAVVQGMVLYAHNKTFNTLGLTSGTDKWGAGNNVDGAQALGFGAQALGFAQIGSANMNESDNTDYGNRPGLSFGRKVGMLKPVFNTAETAAAEDFGVVAFKTAAAA